MTSQQDYFDHIAHGYEHLDTGLTPIRHYSETPSFLKFIGNLQDCTVLELACSDGYFSRILKQQGAASVRALDLSPAMIALAQRQEDAQPLGIQYEVGNIFDLKAGGVFDIVFSPFVLSYAETPEALLQMCQMLYAQLKSGGRLLSMNDNPHLREDSVTGFAKYGKTKRINPPVQDGATLTVTWLNADAPEDTSQHVSFDCVYHTEAMLRWALTEAGFCDIQIHQPIISEQGLQHYPVGYWDLFLDNPLLVFIQAQKP